MRVLWFASSPSLYKPQKYGYNGCGWIESLQKNITSKSDIELGIALHHPEPLFKDKVDGVTFYPVSLYNTKYKHLKHILFYSQYDIVEVKEYLKIIDDFKPDIIHIFGSEASFGLISLYTKIPVVIHIQGILIPYLNAYFSPGSNRSDYSKYLGFRARLTQLSNLYFFKHNAKREEIILRNTKFFMGRTEWDKNVTKIFSPSASYHYCGEILRNEFYESTPWQKSSSNKLILLSTISKVDYKGFDLILKTAKLLSENTNLNFEWIVYGIKEYSFWVKKLKINPDKVNITLRGIASADELVRGIKEADIFIHPSYIDNSPNSVCEAQILGIPVIACNVGGLPSIIEDGINGLLVPSNDPYTLIARINELASDREKAVRLGKQARIVALERHHINDILEQNLKIYNSICNSLVIN